MKRIDYDFIDRSLGYGRAGVGNQNETLVSEKTNVSFELLPILVN
jgi:hypothetical protein